VNEYAALVWAQDPNYWAYHTRTALSEDDYWDRNWVGYLAPGETATARVPIWHGDGGSGSTGFVAWFASSNSNVHGALVTPDWSEFGCPGATTPFHARPNTGSENQQWVSRSGLAIRDAPAYNGSVVTGGGSGTKWPCLWYGGDYLVRVTNDGTTYAPLVMRIWAGMAFWLWQAYFAPPEDADMDYPPTDAPKIIDPRLPYPSIPAVEWDGYWYDGALSIFVSGPNGTWSYDRVLIPNYPK
jgi:hypothetical protein